MLCMQEVNSVEAIKTAVACNLGVAFVSKLAVERETAAGQLHALTVQGIPLTRSLRCVANPARYQSRAVRAFIDIMFDPSAYSPADLPTPLEAEVCAFRPLPPNSTAHILLSSRSCLSRRDAWPCEFVLDDAYIVDFLFLSTAFSPRICHSNCSHLDSSPRIAFASLSKLLFRQHIVSEMQHLNPYAQSPS